MSRAWAVFYQAARAVTLAGVSGKLTPASPRFPNVPAAAGHYESFYLRAVHPSEPLAVWIRYTVRKPPGAQPRGSLWFTLFEPDGVRASKVTLDPAALGVREGEHLHIGQSRIAPGRAVGRAESAQLDASWELEIEYREAPLRHLPRDWMYERPLPRTKSLSLCPAATFRGVVSAGGTRLEVDGWPGMVGHNWGAEHAERWIWLHGVAFEQDAGAWVDLTVGRVRIGPLTTPWIANGALSIGGRRERLGGIGRVRGTEVAEAPTGAELVVPGANGVRLRVSVGAPRERFVAWVYADPDGGQHNTANCSAAAIALTLERPGQRPLELRSGHGGAYELGMRETDHGLQLQPFPD